VHGSTNTMVCSQPTMEHVLSRFIDFLGVYDTTPLTHTMPI
jgi:hypothetical protein